MSPSLVLVLLIGVLYAAGVYVMLERSLTRILIGFLLVGNATNLLLLLMAGRPGEAAFWEDGVTAEEMTDPLPQALILTAIVITMGVSAFLLAMLYRGWWLARDGDETEIQHEGDTVDDGDDLPEQAFDADEVTEQTAADADAASDEQRAAETDEEAAR